VSRFDSANKENARLFLERTEAALNGGLPPPLELGKKIRETVTAFRSDARKRHTFIIPKIHALMQTVDGIDEEKARRAFLCEGHTNALEFCSGTPARTARHPFTKMISTDVTDIMRRWRDGSGSSLVQACPDFAFRDPFPFKVVFEVKYFEQEGTADKAALDLVTNIYQAFFYRALPYVAPKKSGPPWDYDFSCLLAYDASPNQALFAAWNELAEPVRHGFWEGANLYVMILRGHT
jgi:hypothetical protein